MSSGNDAVFLRRNNQVQDAIDSQNMKQALQLIEKRIKKGENTQFLKAWKANVLFSHADETNRTRGIEQIVQLCKTEPAISDIDSLDILHKTLQKMDTHTELRSAIWEKAAKAKPQDRTLQMRWFLLGFEAADWKTAQKAAMGLQKNFPRERKYYFWAIFLSHLISQDPASSEMDKKLFGTLAYRMISKAAADVPSDQSQLLSAPRALQSGEELNFLLRIYQTQSRWSEAVQILDSENAGIDSRIANNDRMFIVEKVNCMGAAGVWPEAYSYAKGLLVVPEDEEGRRDLRERDDWKIWNLLIAAPRHCTEDKGLLSDAQEHIQKFIDFDPKSRNAHVALLDLVLTGLKRAERTEDDLVLACQNYFDVHKLKLYAFKDLRGVLDSCSSSVVDRVSQHCMETVKDKTENAIPLINAYKLQYYAQISANSEVAKSSAETFVRECIELYNRFSSALKTKKSGKEEQGDAAAMESRPMDDFCIIAVMALVTSSQAGDHSKKASNTALIRAAGLLEQLLIDSPHNSGAILILIRIYLLLGAGSIALKLFGRLSVKQMQYESVAHNLYTRLATVHPHSGPPIEGADYKEFDPQAAFVRALDFYRSADITIGHSLEKGLNDGTYVNLEDSIELGNRLRNSVCRRMWALDLRRMQRITRGEHLGRHEEVAQSISPAEDNRKFDIFPSLECNDQPTFEQRLRLGPLPKENWLSSARVADRLFTVLANIGLQKPVDSNLELPALGDLSLSGAEADQTVVEQDAAKIHLELLKVAQFMAGSKTYTTAQIASVLGQIQDWLKSKRQVLMLDETHRSILIKETAVNFAPGIPGAPTWEYFHAIWTLVETLKAMWKVADLDSRKAIKTANLPAEPLKQVKTLVSEVFEDVRSNTRAMKQSLAESATLSTLIDLVERGDTTDEYEQPLQDVLGKMINDGALEVFCGELRENWEEALDGVLGVKL